MAGVAFAIETVRHFFLSLLKIEHMFGIILVKGTLKVDERSREGMVMTWANDRNNTLRLT